MLFVLYIAEERQDQSAKRRKLEAEGVNGAKIVEVKPSAALQLTAAPSAPPAANSKPQHHSLPPRPSFNSFESDATALGLGAPVPEAVAAINASAMVGITGSDKDWVRNRHAIRMANMSAAEMLKAEMMSARPVKAKDEFTKKKSPTPVLNLGNPPVETGPPPPPIIAVEIETTNITLESTTTEDDGSAQETTLAEVTAPDAEMVGPSNGPSNEGTPVPDASMADEKDIAEASPHGTKRKADEVENDNEDEDAPLEADEDEVPADLGDLFRKVKADGVSRAAGYRQVYFM